MKATHKAFSDAVVAMAGDDIDEAIQLLTGSFIGLTTEYMRRRGYETSGEIKIDGGKNRDITIHAVKGEKQNG